MTRTPASTRTSPLDRGFLFLERLGQPVHVGYLNLFSPPEDAGPDFARTLADSLRADAVPVWPFDRHWQGGFGGSWSVDTRFDLEQHFLRVAVASPGTHAELMRLVSELHARPLDRARPPWRVFLIEGLSDGRIATYCQIHHALVDGVAGTRLMLASMSTERDTILPAPWAVGPPEPAPEQGRTNRLPALVPGRITGWMQGLGAVLGAVPAALGEAAQTWRERRRGEADAVVGDQAPACMFNLRISDSREFGARSYSLARIKALCRAFNCTTNDILLALCASALRRYLLDQNALPQQPLIALVPMSTRHDESACGNHVVPLLVTLGTHLADPVERLRLIYDSTGRSIARQVGWNAAEAYGYTLAIAARGLLNQVLRPEGGRLAFNLVISKLSGPRTPMYWQGCRLDGMYPASVLLDGMGLNLTVASRGEWLDFGLVACPRTVPGASRLLDELERAIDELEQRADLGRAAPDAEGPAAGEGRISYPSQAGTPIVRLNMVRGGTARATEPLPAAARSSKSAGGATRNTTSGSL